ncbi:carbon storage regulator CsrA [Aneurinibacillus aneurinilyticus]|uniref:carbon storage regulator CsrA n=1 Tax=Aneurinibacillus aneurinilyticus TaxID=1391 RepID=UPI002E1BBFD8|nr:carbon storage regulator CsrA [Aneurinibacillus aneurinilyticus]MED0670824.1 carbon storage regulator CsrA [Aneurinibacillus aneurinilyticus]
MLVLSRKVGEKIMIGDSIQIKVVSIEGDQIKLGIEAPQSVSIYREEVYETLQQENKLAGQRVSGLNLEQIRKLSLNKE